MWINKASKFLSILIPNDIFIFAEKKKKVEKKTNKDREEERRR